MTGFWSRFIALPAIFLLCLSPVPRISAQDDTATRTPVLVELFTSEGCSTCPPADALLLKLQQEQPIPGAEIIVLGEHVDYWDGEGWHDRFSSHQFTTRQNTYGARFKLESVYTPQMVVDGSEQFVGNDAAKATRTIAHAAQTAKPGLRLSDLLATRDRVAGTVSLPPNSAALPDGDLFAALIDPTAETSVRGGENGGRQLHHAGVVRALVRIGSSKTLNTAPAKFTLSSPADAAHGRKHVVVFAQRSGQGAVVAAVLGSVQPATGQPNVAATH
jgi:hypothetical protein